MFVVYLVFLPFYSLLSLLATPFRMATQDRGAVRSTLVRDMQGLIPVFGPFLVMRSWELELESFGLDSSQL